MGFIPGLGAVYNGEYTKAIVHVAIFAGLITLASTGPRQGFYGTLIPFFCMYMPIEAFITARKKAGASRIARVRAGGRGGGFARYD